MSAADLDASVELRARSATEIIDAAVQLVRRHLAPMLVISAIAVAPAGTITYLRLHAIIPLWTQWLELPFVMLMDAALVVGARDAYEGRVPEPARALRLAARRAWPVVAAGMYRNVLITVGLLILVAPGLMMLATFALVPGIAVLEPTGGAGRAMRRSGELTEGWRWHALAAHGLPSLFLLTGTVALQLVYRKLGSPSFLGGTGMTLASMLLRPFTSAIQVVLYFDLRIRKEAYDIERMLAAEPAAA